MPAEDAMTRRRNDLSPRTRWLLAAGAAAEAGLKAAALLDMRRRPAGQIRGSKRAWALAMIVNSAGLIPISYFVFGVRRTETADQTTTHA
jgi:hypothetical protein